MGPMDLAGFSLESFLMRRKESHTFKCLEGAQRSRGSDARFPLGGHKESDTSLQRDTCLRWGDCHRLQSWALAAMPFPGWRELLSFP